MPWRLTTLIALAAAFVGAVASRVWMIAWTYLVKIYADRFPDMLEFAKLHVGGNYKATALAISYGMDLLIPAMLFIPLGGIAAWFLREHRLTIALAFSAGVLFAPVAELAWDARLDLIPHYVSSFLWIAPLFALVGFFIVVARTDKRRAP